MGLAWFLIIICVWVYLADDMDISQPNPEGGEILWVVICSRNRCAYNGDELWYDNNNILACVVDLAVFLATPHPRKVKSQKSFSFNSSLTFYEGEFYISLSRFN